MTDENAVKNTTFACEVSSGRGIEESGAERPISDKEVLSDLRVDLWSTRKEPRAAVMFLSLDAFTARPRLIAGSNLSSIT